MIRADYTDKELVVDILTNSFDDNRSVNYIVRNDKRRAERIRNLMRYSFNVCNHFGKVVVSENKKACALILFPDKKRTTIKSFLWDLQLVKNCVGIKGISKAMSREKRIKALQPKEPLYYLWFIGVSPDAQNKGIGSALLSEVISDNEAEGRILCLETSTEKNIPWYQKFGFTVYDELDLGYRLFFLKR